MKKYVKRIFVIVLGIILCGYNFCYADMIILSRAHQMAYKGMLLVPIGGLIFLALLGSYISLKSTAKIEKSSGQITIETQKKLNNHAKYLSACIFVLTMLIVTIVSFLNEEYYSIIWLISTIVLLIICIILRITDKKKIAYIIYAIAIAIFCVSCIYGDSFKEERRLPTLLTREISAFNARFEAYQGTNKTINEVRNLYYTVLTTNAVNKKNGYPERTISISGIIRLDKDYTSNSSLEQLRSSKLYEIKMIYSKEGWISSINIEEQKV